MPTTTNMDIPYPASTDHVRIWEHLQSLADQVDAVLSLPARQTAVSDIIMQLTSGAATWAAFPTPLQVTIAAHATLDTRWELNFFTWINCSAGEVRCSFTTSGGVTNAAGVNGIHLSNGAYIYQGIAYLRHQMTGFLTLPAGTGNTTVAVHGYRSSTSGTQQVNYVSLSATPIARVA